MAIARKNKSGDTVKVVYGIQDTIVRYEFGQVHIHRNEGFESTHPLVIARPELFSSIFPGDISRPDRAVATSWRVESATRAPGETR